MKKYILITALFISAIGFSQNLENSIEKDQAKNIEKLIAKEEPIDVEIEVYIDEEATAVSPIVHAINYGSIEVLKTFIQHKELFKNYENEIAKGFVLAVSHGYDDIAELLFEQGPNLNHKCDHCYYATAIMVAVSSGNEKWYNKLKPKSDLHLITDKKQNILHYAASSPNKSITKDVLKIEGNDLNLMSDYEITPLGKAILNIDQPELYSELIALGGDPSVLNDLVYIAVAGNHLEALEYALKNNFTYNLWQINEDSDSYILEEAVFMHEGLEDTDELRYTKKQDAFVKRILELYLKEKPDKSKEHHWDLLYDINMFNNLIDLSFEFNNKEIVQLYFQLVGEMQQSGVYYSFPKKMRSKAIKTWGKEFINQLMNENDVQ